MVKVKLNKAVSYKGKVYPANTMFTIKDIDLDELKNLVLLSQKTKLMKK